MNKQNSYTLYLIRKELMADNAMRGIIRPHCSKI